MSGKEWDREPRNIGHLITRARRRGDRMSRRGFIAPVQRGSTMRSIHFARPSCRSSSPLPSRRRKLHLLRQPDGVGDRSVRGNAHGIRGHDVSGPHGVSSSFEFRACLSAGARPLYDGKNFERRGPYAHASYQSARISPISIAISAAATAGLPRMCVPPPCVAMHLETSPRRPRIYSFMQCARNRADGPDRRAVWSASGHSQIAAFFAARSGHS